MDSAIQSVPASVGSPPKASVRRLGRATLVYLLFLVVLMTWAPFRFAFPTWESVELLTTPRDALQNVVLFVVPGIVLSAILSVQRGDSKLAQILGRFVPMGARAVDSVGFAALRGFGFGVAFSLVIETGQLFLADRSTNALDVLFNGLGAALGAALLQLARKRLRRRVTSKFALELPLTQVGYGITLLLLLNGLVASTNERFAVAAPLLGVAGALIILSIWQHRLRSALSTTGLGLTVAGWYFASASTALFVAPAYTVGAALALGLSTSLLARVLPAPDRERRFELPTLFRMLPFFLAYVALTAVWSDAALPHRPLDALPQGAVGASMASVLRSVELLVSLTLAGFMASQYASRRHQGMGVIILAGLTVVLFAAAIELLHATTAGLGSQREFTASALAGGFGVLLHQLHLDAIRVVPVRARSEVADPSVYLAVELGTPALRLPALSLNQPVPLSRGGSPPCARPIPGKRLPLSSASVLPLRSGPTSSRRPKQVRRLDWR